MGFMMDTIGYKLVRRGKVPTTDQFIKESKVLGKEIPWVDGTWHFAEDLIMPWGR